MDFRILHRFGELNQGYKNFFGLDQASMRMGFDFGILQNLMAGFGRSTYKKELDAYIKYAPIRQSTGPWSSPVTFALVAGITMDGLPWLILTGKFSYFQAGLLFRGYHRKKIQRKLYTPGVSNYGAQKPCTDTDRSK